jgi:PAS domain S-box-containing protein
MYANLPQLGIFRILHQIAGHFRSSRQLQQMLKASVDTLGRSFDLDRCAVLVLNTSKQELELAAEFFREPFQPLGRIRYQLWTNSEWYRLLAAGRPVPLKEIRPVSGETDAAPVFERFIEDSNSKSLVAFPLIFDDRLIGCMTVHYCQESRALSDELLELSEAVADELAMGIVHFRLVEDKDLEGRLVRDAQLPLLLLEQDSGRILRANRACSKLLGFSGDELVGMCLFELFGSSDGQRLESALREIQGGGGPLAVRGMVARSATGQSLMIDVALSALDQENRPPALAALVPHLPASGSAAGGESAEDPRLVRISKAEEMIATLSRQLNWERIVRHIVSAVHSSLDRDSLLQTTVDLLGRALGASRCLIVRTDGPVSPVVTHEYVQSDISPLGLGRTSQLPLALVSLFKAKTLTIYDLAASPGPLDLPASDRDRLIDGGFRSLLGTPVSHHGVVHGVIVVVHAERPRQWSNQELELLEIVAHQVAIALSHAQSFAQIKDQLFNMNLLGTLSQQLTNALDLATRAAKPAGQEEAARQLAPSPPLSLRELEVLKLIAQGLANREIAQRLFLTESTVELHASRIRKKLKLKSRTALVKYACDNRLV